MVKSPDSYKIASHIHDTFLGINGLLTAVELVQSEVVISIGSSSSKTSQRIETRGIVNGKRVSQVLALDGRDMYHLATLELEENGKLIKAHIGPQSPVENLDVLVNTLFMHKLVKIALARSI